jgi:dihydrodipicolinate synthase/N-acetylneuraminate lyase
MIANKYFILLLSWMLVGGQGFSSNLGHFDPGEKAPVSAEYVAG